MKKGKGKTFLILIGIIVGLIAVYALIAFVFQSPALVEFRDSLAFNLVFLILISVALLLVAFLPVCKQPIRAQIGLLIAVALIWINAFCFTVRVSCLIYYFSGVAMTVAEGIYALMHVKQDSRETMKPSKTLILIGVVCFLFAMLITSRATAITGFPFWLPAVITSGVATVVSIAIVVIVGKRAAEPMTRATKANLILIPIGVLIIAFLFVFLSCSAWNFGFDTSKPYDCACTVTDKKISSGARQATSYTLYLDYEGKSIHVDVSDTDYYSYEVGDDITVRLYEGALGEAYYYYE